MKFRETRYTEPIEGNFVTIDCPGNCIIETERGWSRMPCIPDSYQSVGTDEYLHVMLPEHIKPYKNRFPHNGLVTIYPTQKGWSIEQDKLVVGHCETFPDMQIKSVWVRHGLPQVSGWLK